MFAFCTRALPLRTLTFWLIILSSLTFIYSPTSLGLDHEHSKQAPQHEHEKEEREHEHLEPEHSKGEHDHQEHINITSEIAQQFNITTERVTSGLITNKIRVYGKIVNDASQISHIGARFDGTIMQVNVNIGDHVKKGQALARIESNQSLHPYIVKAPFSGMITARHANPGELTQEQPLFTLYNDAILWAEFKIFPNQMGTIKVGQSVVIDNETFNIAHIIPSDPQAPYSLARVQLDNHDHGWSAGIMVKGEVLTQQYKAALRVDNKALQALDGNTVVFIKQKNEFHAQPVKIGLQNNEYSEILSGLNENDEYVVTNSYLIKADFEKSGAEHVH